ncbi:Uncharacterised protein [Chlamydia trachomatis]|nr:Uncharacterised protein [Chlamydia trachomatis]
MVVCVSVAVFSKTLCSEDALGTTYAQATLNTTIKIANPHVVFSITSVVFRTPIMAFDEEKLEANPPPFDSWITTITTIKIEARTISPTNNVYIIFLLVYFII